MGYYEENSNKIFKKYTNNELLKDIDNYIYGKGKLNRVLNHFFEETIYESKSIRGNLSPMEALHDEETMKKILDYIKTKPKFYVGDEISNVKSFFRNGGKYACKVANFCPVNARDIYKELIQLYGIKKEHYNVLDPSSGFGSRMSATILMGNNYYGIDPNTELCDRLNGLIDFYKTFGYLQGVANIYCCGSEKSIEELSNSIDICFTSPPYFDLEIYCNESTQSISYGNYENWIRYYVKPTIENIKKYLVDGGVVAINIKNMTYGKKYKLFDDWFKIFIDCGFSYVKTIEMSHQSKKNYYMNTTYSAEQYTGFKESIMVFKKTNGDIK